jgi:hypothetical protein
MVIVFFIVISNAEALSVFYNLDEWLPMFRRMDDLWRYFKFDRYSLFPIFDYDNKYKWRKKNQ